MAAERCLLAAALLLAVALAGAGPVAAPQPTDTVGSSGAGSEQDKNGRQAAAGSGADDAGTGSSDTQTQLGTGQAQTDQAEAKFYDLNGTTRVFFNYGVTLTALIYGLMGVSYFYGPYSKEALAARRRAEQRIQHLKLKLGKDDVGEVDYGYFTEEAAAGDGGYAGEDYGYDRVGEGAPPPASWTDDGRYQLVMARSGAGGVNRRGEPADAPLRLRGGPGGPARLSGNGITPSVVNVLDMQSVECRTWIDCLENRAQRAQQRSDTEGPEPEDACDQFFFTCPTEARSLGELADGHEAYTG